MPSPKKQDKRKIVLVRWKDAWGNENLDAHMGDSRGPVMQQSVGFLVSMTTEGITLSPLRFEDPSEATNGEFRGLLYIPSGMVEEIKICSSFRKPS